MQDKDELIYHVKQANKEKDELIEKLLKDLYEAEKQIKFLEGSLADVCRVIPERN